MESSRFLSLALPHKNQVIELGLKCWEIALKEAENKTFTDEIVYQLLRSPYRPGLLFVCWPIGPDDSNESAACAGHLQTMGYRLLAAAGSFYTYIYVDQCMYEICSWARTDCNNPMFEEYREQIFNAFNPIADTTGPTPVESVAPVPK